MAKPASTDLWIASQYQLIEHISRGSFGKLYEAQDVNGKRYAVKLEKRKRIGFLLGEARYYKQLRPRGTRCCGIPKVHWYGMQGDYNVMVMDLLGPNLEDLFNYCGRIFSLKTTLMLMEQMLARIETVHAGGVVHRDIKADNFAMGIGETSHHVYVIDFGLSTPYRQKDGAHIPYDDQDAMVGTARYCSVRSHRGIAQTRRDDLEAIGYLAMYFLRGGLPWQAVPSSHRQGDKADEAEDRRVAKIGKLKDRTPVAVLCKGYPREFATYLNYCKGLKYAEDPDYDYCRQLFRNLMALNGYECDFKYDWNLRTTDLVVSKDPMEQVELCPPSPPSRGPDDVELISSNTSIPVSELHAEGD
eukprot:NODE_1925_length_1560_cov_118.241475_g1832_i0.p1 GENE.NODE_1925_length_1560_cov_118.241475_g1832_i0~~NODE_1925_length_1560_cov_118.241475_g1832_i0.p1  ORF type:complete len:358 (-),score=46.45 NODE_1925_length_1560_cov_118.241475_g1832_i0:371-1444(-)